jgi:DNA polymerase-3 subunit epsilon
MNSISLKEIPIEKAEFCVIDFETTGTSAAKGKVIEIGMVKVKNLKITDLYQSFLNPLSHIPSFITRLTGITYSDVEDAPLFKDILEDVSYFLGDSILVAHNLPFDYSFLKKEMSEAGWKLFDNPTLCTLSLARKFYPDLPSKSLGAMVKHFRVKHKNVHRALGDATVTAKILIKMIEYAREEYNIETASQLVGMQTGLSSKSSFRIMKKKLADGFAELPELPGIYIFKNAKDKILYIGKAKSLKRRVRNYFSSNAERKTKKIIRAASKLEHIVTNSELTALLAEAALIKSENPKMNTMLKNYSQNYFLKINLLHPYSDVNVNQVFDFDGNDYFGPYNNRDTASALCDIVNLTFSLRECTDKDFAKSRKCYLHDIKRCFAPCIENLEKEYQLEMERVYNFLSGNNQEAVNRLLDKMKKLSAKQKYEEAAQIRDTVNLILNQMNKSSILAEPINKTNVLIEVSEGTIKDYILLIEGKVFVKQDILEEKNLFDTALEDFYAGSLHLFPGIENKDLEKIKITLAWLVKNRTKVKLYYLNNYESVEELLFNVGLKNGKKILS